MRVLVAIASKHGSTAGIAQTIAVQLRMEDLNVDERNVDEVANVEGYDAVILGSAVYMGKLMPEATAFVEKHQAQLGNIPVWLFSSGPVGAPEAKPRGEAIDVEQIVAKVHARGHVVFAGKLDKHELGLVERIATKVVAAPEGDFRDWTAIESWAREIARELTAQNA